MSLIPVSILSLVSGDEQVARLVDALQSAGFAPQVRLVATASALRDALRECSWDLLLIDPAVPSADTAEVLDAARACDVPAILVTDPAYADVGLAALGNGAADYFEWHDLRRLGHAVARELRPASDRRGRKRKGFIRPVRRRRGWQRPILRGASRSSRVAALLRESERQLAEAQRLAQIGSWSRDLRTDREQWSEELYRLYDLDPGAIKPTYATYLSVVHPDDRETACEATDRCLVTREPGTYRCRILHRDGSVHTMLVRARVIEEHGRPAWLCGTAQDITESVRAEEALRQTNETLEALFQAVPLAIATYDRDWGITHWNPAAERVFGWRAEQVLAQVSPTIPPERAGENAQLRRELSEGRRIADRETVRVRRDGQPIDISLSAAPLRDADGTIRGYTAVMTEISARKQAEDALRMSEERLRRRAAELQALYDTALQLNAQLEPGDLLRLIVEEAVALLEAEAGGFYIYQPDRQALCMELGIHYFDSYIGRYIRPGEGISGRAFAERRAVIVDDYAGWPGRSPEYASDPRLKALLSVPLLGREEVLGVLTISGGQRKFDERDAWLAELFAAQATGALQTARLHAELRRRARQLSALNKAGQVIAGTLDLSAVLDGIISEVGSLLNARAASVLLYDDTDGSLVFAAAVGADAQTLAGRRLPPGAGLAGWVARERRSVLANDAPHDPRFYKDISEITGMLTRSVLAVPLVARGALVGVIEVVHREINAFTPQDQATLEAMAATAAIAIDNARLYQSEREQYRRLERSQAQLVRSEKLAALGRLIASLAHELNNPLQSMQTCLELILDFPLDAPEQREYLLGVKREAERLTTLCARVLDFARPLALERQPTDVAESVRYALSVAGKQLEYSRVALKLDLPDDLPPVLASRDRLAQVFLNLIINASEAMPRGGQLRISACVAGAHIEVRVADTGAGISPEALPLLFEPLYTTKETGTGLGLAICYNIVQQLGGTIAAANVPDGGAVFTVRLPSSEARSATP